MSDSFTVAYGKAYPVRPPGPGESTRKAINIHGPAVYYATTANFEADEGTELAPGESVTVERQLWVRTPDRHIQTKILVVAES